MLLLETLGAIGAKIASAGLLNPGRDRGGYRVVGVTGAGAGAAGILPGQDVVEVAVTETSPEAAAPTETPNTPDVLTPEVTMVVVEPVAPPVPAPETVESTDDDDDDQDDHGEAEDADEDDGRRGRGRRLTVRM